MKLNKLLETCAQYEVVLCSIFLHSQHILCFYCYDNIIANIRSGSQHLLLDILFLVIKIRFELHASFQLQNNSFLNAF